LLRGKGKFYRDSVKLAIILRSEGVAVGSGTGSKHGHAFDEAHYIIDRILNAGGNLSKSKGVYLGDTEKKRGSDL
jgi:hypothetical protein